jgi:uncharacterized membrane protein YbhN (UPF0104 family)
VSWRRAIVSALSVALTFASFLFLSKLGGVDIRLWIRELRGANPALFALLALLTAIHIFLATWKWRCVDAVVRRPSDTKLSWGTSFALTSMGAALGQVLPIHACMAAARSFGTKFYGSPLRRGTAGTIFEQGFDFLIIVFLAIASAVTWLCNGGWALWTATAVAIVVLAIFAVGICIRVLSRVADFYFKHFAKRAPAETGTPNPIAFAFLNIQLGRRLMLLSAARSLVQIVMAAVAAATVGIHIATWQLAAALPFVILATVLAITPGGLGVTELTYTGALNLFGVPLGLGAQWALASRALVLSSCFVVAAITGVLALGGKLKTGSSSEVIEEVTVSSGP